MKLSGNELDQIPFFSVSQESNLLSEMPLRMLIPEAILSSRFA